MTKVHLFLCIVITSLVLIFSANTVRAFTCQKADATVKITKPKLAFGISPTQLPNSNDHDVPEIKAASFTSSLPSTLCIHTDQEILCLFEICFKENQFEEYRPSIPVSLSSLFLHLFSIVVSPNAP